MITTEELLSRVGLLTRQTLQIWRKAGLVRQPEIRTAPSGRGRALYWDEATVEDCLRVKRLQRERKTLAEIGKIVGNPCKTQPKATTAKRKAKSKSIYDFDSETIAFTEIVVRSVKRVARYVRDTPTRELTKPEHMKEAIAMAKKGIAPIYVVHEESISVIPDYALGPYLADVSNPVAVIVLPLKSLLGGHLTEATTERELEHRKGMDHRVIDLGGTGKK
jgi:DNA-binding transcriptional MerR regulator